MNMLHILRYFFDLGVIVGPIPNVILNGQVEDAVPVMANFTWLMNQVNANAAALPLTPQLASNNLYTGINSLPVLRLTPLTGIDGDGTTITASSVAAVVSYIEGEQFLLIPNLTDASGSGSLDINTIGPKPILLGGVAVSPGVLIQDVPYVVTYSSTLDGFSLGGGGAGGGAGGSISLQVNSTPNIVQNILNLVNGTHGTVADNGDGSVTFDVTGVLVPADIGSTVEGYDASILKSADIGSTVEGYDASILKSADIGSTVEGYDANIAKINVVQSWTKAQRGTPVALTSSGASIAVDLSLANNFYHTTTEDTTLAAPSNSVAGQAGTINFTQGSPVRTLAFNAFWKFANGAAPSLTSTIGAKDNLSYIVDETASYATCSMLPKVS